MPSHRVALLGVLLAATFPAFAQSPAGRWTAVVEAPDGLVSSFLDLALDGERLTESPQQVLDGERQREHVAPPPVRLRERNALRPGDTTAAGQRLGADCSALMVLREAVRKTDFTRRRRAARKNRGIGLPLSFHGSGFTGGCTCTQQLSAPAIEARFSISQRATSRPIPGDPWFSPTKKRLSLYFCGLVQFTAQP